MASVFFLFGIVGLVCCHQQPLFKLRTFLFPGEQGNPAPYKRKPFFHWYAWVTLLLR